MRGPDVLEKSRVGGTELWDLSPALYPEPALSGRGPLTSLTCTVHQEKWNNNQYAYSTTLLWESKQWKCIMKSFWILLVCLIKVSNNIVAIKILRWCRTEALESAPRLTCRGRQAGLPRKGRQRAGLQKTPPSRAEHGSSSAALAFFASEAITGLLSTDNFQWLILNTLPKFCV